MVTQPHSGGVLPRSLSPVSLIGLSAVSLSGLGFDTRRAQRRSRLAEGHRRRRREAVLTAASTTRGSIRSGALAAQSPPEAINIRCDPETGGPAGLPPRRILSSLTIGRKSVFADRGGFLIRRPLAINGLPGKGVSRGTNMMACYAGKTGDVWRPTAISGEGRGTRRRGAVPPGRKALGELVSPVGLEPTAPRLKVSCSTT
jgi:hypothetical protein